MKGDPQAIAFLQAQLKNELTAINQYFVHYRMFKHWGFDKLAKKEYSESIGEMKHADWLMDRIFMLDGLPNLQDLGKLNIGETVPELLGSDLALERAAQLCMALGTDGLRGDLTLIRAARALAALDGDAQVSDAHFRRIAGPALRHRLRRNPLDNAGSTARVERAVAEILK